ncbi:MAG: hypothetical protein GY898_28495 [Proteobacteria bacterium]|nr:hypothetical protein [Pseudomonadota bacterium]
MKRPTALLALILCTLLALPAAAEEPAPAPEPTPKEALDKMMGKEFRDAVRDMDREDTAVRYALSVRREGGILIAAGGVIMGITLLSGAVNLLSSEGGTQAPFIAGAGVPAGLAVLVTGVPAMMGSNHYLHHYLDHAPTTRLGRLRMMRAWRTNLFQLRRDTGLIGSAFVGAIAVLSGVVWAARDNLGVNGDPGGVYSYSDMFTTLSFAAAGGALALFGLIGHLEYTAETQTPHRLYARVSGSVAPVVSRDGGGGVSASLTIVF